MDALSRLRLTSFLSRSCAYHGACQQGACEGGYQGLHAHQSVVQVLRVNVLQLTAPLLVCTQLALQAATLVIYGRQLSLQLSLDQRALEELVLVLCAERSVFKQRRDRAPRRQPHLLQPCGLG